MPKYIIEGEIDFYAELHHQPKQQPCTTTITASVVDAVVDDDDHDHETKLCLLSKLPLEYGHITLPCNHVFNFMPLYNEVLSQKTNPELLKNVYHTKISKNHIKCPYCRVIHANVLLPYIVGDARVSGVNGPSTMCMATPFKCQHSVMVSKSVGAGSRKKRAILSECSAVKNIYCWRGDDGLSEIKFLCKKHTTPPKTPKTPKTPKNNMKNNSNDQNQNID